jgi:hypothetical protein
MSAPHLASQWCCMVRYHVLQLGGRQPAAMEQGQFLDTVPHDAVDILSNPLPPEEKGACLTIYITTSDSLDPMAPRTAHHPKPHHSAYKDLFGDSRQQMFVQLL